MGAFWNTLSGTNGFSVCCQRSASSLCHLANLLKSHFWRERKGAVSNQSHQGTWMRFLGVLGGKGCTRKGRGSYEVGCATFKIHIQHTQCYSPCEGRTKALRLSFSRCIGKKKNQTRAGPALGKVSRWMQRAPRTEVECDVGCGNWNPAHRFHDKNQKTKTQKATDKYTELFKLKEL